MPEQLSNDWKSQPAACANARICVAEVVNTDAFEARALRNGFPGSLKVCSRVLKIITGDYVGTVTVQPCEDCKGRGVQDDGFSPGLAIRQKQQAPLYINVLPFEMENFAKAA